MTIEQIAENLRSADWSRIHIWSGKLVDRVYVTSRSGFDCGHIQVDMHGNVTFELTLHETLIREAAGIGS